MLSPWVGVLLVVFSRHYLPGMKRNAINYVLPPLTLVSFFVDIISYVRLFAVGVVTVASWTASTEWPLPLGLKLTATTY